MAHEMIGTQIVTERLVALLESGTEKVLLIDSRPFVEYNTSHILEAININCSKLMKRRLQQDKVLITELIQHSAKHKVKALFFFLFKINGHTEGGIILNEASFLRGESNLRKFWLLFKLWYLMIPQNNLLTILSPLRIFLNYTERLTCFSLVKGYIFPLMSC